MSPATPVPKRHRLALDLPVQLHAELRASAEANFRSVSAEIREAIRDHIDRHNPPARAKETQK